MKPAIGTEEASMAWRRGVDLRSIVQDVYMIGRLSARRSWQVCARAVTFGGVQEGTSPGASIVRPMISKSSSVGSESNGMAGESDTRLFVMITPVPSDRL